MGKKLPNGLFDKTMGSSDGAESCELVGNFLFHQITSAHSENFGI